MANTWKDTPSVYREENRVKKSSKHSKMKPYDKIGERKNKKFNSEW